MVITNWQKEIDGIVRAEGLTWSRVGEAAGMTRQGAYAITHSTEHIIPKSVVKVLESLGYDIEIEFVRRK